MPKVKAEMLIGDRQSIALDYIRYSKTYNPTLSGDTVIDGETISGTAKFDGKLRLDLSKAAYKWWFGDQKRRIRRGHWRGLLPRQGGRHGQRHGARHSQRAASVALGKRDRFHQRRRLRTGAGRLAGAIRSPRMCACMSKHRGIKKNGGKINGHIYSGAVGVEWFLAKNIGLALDYGIQKIDLRRDSDRDSALRIKLAGPSAYLKARF